MLPFVPLMRDDLASDNSSAKGMLDVTKGREYIQYSRSIVPEVTDEVATAIQDEFVTCRATNKNLGVSFIRILYEFIFYRLTLIHGLY